MSISSALLGVDLGTTHCKAALFDGEGTLLQLAIRPTPVSQTDEGLPFHDPDELWSVAVSAIREVVTSGTDRSVSVVGVTSMAEAGLLIDVASGTPRTHTIPWYDRRASVQVEEMARVEAPRSLFGRSGLHPSFKFALPKLLWLRERAPELLDGACWLSVADYVVFRLTGCIATDPTLAARTYAFSLQSGGWDEPWIRRLGFELSLFPPLRPSGTPAGGISAAAAEWTGLVEGTPAAVCGHDHVCTMLAAGVVGEGRVLDSIGTAESLLGVLPHLRLDAAAFDSGLAFVPHVLPGRYCWLGGLSAAGGSIEWLRERLSDESLSYEEIVRLASGVADRPTGILYFPYLSGSGAPLPDGNVRAAFIGLHARHTRGDLVKAVLEGTAFAAESIRQAAEEHTDCPIDSVVAVGGGAGNDLWMQIKADISGTAFHVPAIPQATVLGAALTAGLGSGVLPGLDVVRSVAERHMSAGKTFLPDAQRHAVYSHLYIHGFMGFQEPLRRIGRAMELPARDG